MKPQTLTFGGCIVATAMTMTAVFRAQPAWALALGLASIGLWIATRHQQHRSPIPFPYSLRWLLHLPRITDSPTRLEQMLQPQSGERLLEIGPGIGIHALPIASMLAPGGLLAAVDVQRDMLAEIRRRAEDAEITNICTTRADAAKLPYPDEVFDGAYLVGVLGEIPDEEGALRELHRVLKPGARLVIGEIFYDPDFSCLGVVRERMSRGGFMFCRKRGIAPAYLARFQRVAMP